MASDEQVWLTRKEVAERLGVSIQTVYRWTREGRLTAYQGPGGQYRHKVADIDSVVRKVEAKVDERTAEGRQPSREEYVEMLEAMLDPAEAEGGFEYAKDGDW